MKTTNKQSKESGQILLILTVGIVALLGFLALAVDGGMIYADRRFDQNAADASSFAGAGAAAMQLENNNILYADFDCTGAFLASGAPNPAHPLYGAINDAINAALARGASNNFTLQFPLADQHGVEILCSSPATFGPRYLAVRTVVSSTVRTAFAHLFYEGDVRNTVEAIVKVFPPYDVGYGYALATLSEDCKKELTFQGNALIKLSGGGAHSNSGITRGGNTKTEILDGGKATYNNSTCGYKDSGGAGGGSGYITPEPKQESLLIPKVYLEDPPTSINWATECPADYIDTSVGENNPKRRSITNGGTIEPLRYKSIQVNAGETLNMKPGLYCVEEDFNGVGGTINTIADGSLPEGVTVILLGGSVEIGGNVTVSMIASSEPLDRWYGLLFYSAKGNTSAHKLLGTGSSYFEGTLWFPDGHITLAGDGDETTYKYNTQVVADQITVTGNNFLNMTYDQSRMFRLSSLVNLDK
jgi:hypothetical protein